MPGGDGTSAYEAHGMPIAYPKIHTSDLRPRPCNRNAVRLLDEVSIAMTVVSAHDRLFPAGAGGVLALVGGCHMYVAGVAFVGLP